MKNIIVFSSIALILSSCMTTYNGVMTPTQDLKNIQYVNTAFGSSKATSSMGMSKSKHDALVLEARINMMKNFPLDSNQYFVNYGIDFRKQNFLFVQTCTVTVSADIVQDKSVLSDQNYTSELKARLGFESVKSTLKIGDTVIDRKLNYYVVEASKGASVVVKPVGKSDARFFNKIKQRNQLFTNPNQMNPANTKKNFVFDN